MPRGTHTYACEVCGKTVTRRRDLSKSMLCLECAITRMLQAHKSMQEKEGEFYERWRAAFEQSPKTEKEQK